MLTPKFGAKKADFHNDQPVIYSNNSKSRFFFSQLPKYNKIQFFLKFFKIMDGGFQGVFGSTHPTTPWYIID